MSANQIVFQVQGSSLDPYNVVFIKNEELIATCDCSAGQNQQQCKHRISILEGDLTAVVSGNKDEAANIASWLTGTKLASALNELAAAEKDAEVAKKRLTGANKALARAMQGCPTTICEPLHETELRSTLEIE